MIKFYDYAGLIPQNTISSGVAAQAADEERAKREKAARVYAAKPPAPVAPVVPTGGVGTSAPETDNSIKAGQMIVPGAAAAGVGAGLLKKLLGTKVGRVAKGLVAGEAALAPLSAMDDPRMWGGADMPLSEAAKGGAITGIKDPRLAAVARGEYKDAVSTPEDELYYGWAPTKFGGLLGMGERALRGVRSQWEGVKGLWAGAGQGIGYALTGDPAMIGKTQAEEDAMGMGARAAAAVTRPFGLIGDINNWVATPYGRKLDMGGAGFRESGVAGQLSAVDAQSEELIKQWTPERIQTFMNLASTATTPEEKERYATAMRNPVLQEAIRRQAEAKNVTPDALLRPDLTKFQSTPQQMAGIGATTVADPGVDPQGKPLGTPMQQYSNDLAVPLEKGEYAIMSIDPATGKPVRARAGYGGDRAGDAMTYARQRQLLAGDPTGASAEARQLYATRANEMSQAFQMEDKYAKIMAQMNKGFEAYNPATGETITAEELNSLPPQEADRVLRNWEAHNKSVPAEQRIMMREVAKPAAPAEAPAAGGIGGAKPAPAPGDLDTVEVDPETVKAKAMADAEANLSKLDKMALQFGESSNDTGKQKKAAAIRAKIAKVGQAAFDKAKRDGIIARKKGRLKAELASAEKIAQITADGRAAAVNKNEGLSIDNKRVVAYMKMLKDLMSQYEDDDPAKAEIAAEYDALLKSQKGSFGIGQ